MKSLGARAIGERLERMRASALWAGAGFRNQYPIPPGLRDPQARMPSLSDFLCGGTRRVPGAPLPAQDPRERWLQAPRQRPARHLARAQHGAGRDRRRAPADRPGVGPARLALATGRAQAFPADAGVAARRCRRSMRCWSRTTTTTTCATRRSVRWPRPACPSSPAWASARTCRPGAWSRNASPNSTGGKATACRAPASRSRRRRRSTSRAAG